MYQLNHIHMLVCTNCTSAVSYSVTIFLSLISFSNSYKFPVVRADVIG